VLERDEAARALGIELVEATEGRATVRMTVRPDMVNAHGTCHGGLLFTLADTAFALACNSYGSLTVAAGATIEFLAPAAPGAVLTARCVERVREGRSGVYDVEVVDGEGGAVAVFRGRSRTVGG
jgi:acyl-CoA thioesterase